MRGQNSLWEYTHYELGSKALHDLYICLFEPLYHLGKVNGDHIALGLGVEFRMIA